MSNAKPETHSAVVGDPTSAEREALLKLVAEVDGVMSAFEPELRRLISNTNFQCIQLRVREAEAVLARAALQPPQAQPVAWQCRASADENWQHVFFYSQQDAERWCKDGDGHGQMRPLYASPPAPHREQQTPAGWLPIESAPDRCIVANFLGDRLYWAEAAHRGRGVMSACWYSPHGKSVPSPTHWMPLPSPPAPKLEGGGE